MSPHGSLVPRWLIVHSRLAVWVVVGGLIILAAVGTLLGYASRPGAQPFAPQDPVAFLGSAVVIAGYSLVFALLVRRVPANVIGWIFGIFAVAVAIGNASWAYITYATVTVPPQLPAVGAAMLIGAGTIPWWTFLLIVLLVSFPDGRPIATSWGWFLVAAGVLAVVCSLSIVFGSGAVPIWLMESPLALPGPSGRALAATARIGVIVLILMVVPAIWALILRYRAADDIGRLQLKWLVYAGAMFLACGVVFWLLAGVAYERGSGLSTANWLLLCFGTVLVPVAAGVAILRYHLYDIETIIGRTLVYGGLTAILAGMYTAGIRLFNWLFVELTGEDSDAALVLTTLVLATTFTPIKSWLESKVATRKGIIVDPDEAAALRPPAAMAPDDAPGGATPTDADLAPDEERIARRAAAIVLERLAMPVTPTDAANPSGSASDGPRTSAPASG